MSAWAKYHILSDWGSLYKWKLKSTGDGYGYPQEMVTIAAGQPETPETILTNHAATKSHVWDGNYLHPQLFQFPNSSGS